MKKLSKALAIALATSAMVVPTLASTIGLRINNQFVTPVVAPFEKSGTTLVPLRIVSENLGAKVDWNVKAKAITITQEDTVIVLTVGSKSAEVNGVTKELLLPPQMKNNTTMVPIRFVSENLNCTVGWDKATQIVSVNAKDVEVVAPNEGAKVTTFINPKVINGVVYLTKEQMIEAFDVEIEMHLPHTAEITRADFHTWLIGKDWVAQKNIKVGDSPNRINWAYQPLKDINSELWIKENNTFYYPLNYLAQYLNSTPIYNSDSKEITIVNNGIKRVETVKTDKTTLSGYAYYPDGTPVKGARVSLLKLESITYVADTQFTDENGYYEIPNFECKKYPHIRSSITIDANESKDGKRYHGDIPSFATVNEDMKFGFYTAVTKLPDVVVRPMPLK